MSKSCSISSTQLIQLPQGHIKGIQRQSIYGQDYYSFEGIPYAKPPLGILRFKAPLPAEPWSGILDCTEFEKKPVQRNPNTKQLEGVEDCLYLNVYAKKLNSAKPLPVLVWIYGGAFAMGEATRNLFSPDYFMAKDVILVTFNYRLCALGFLSLQDASLEVPGNAGLKDQVLALKWIKQNITHFNGDASNITIFGESAGGVSTHYMMATKQTCGLFQRTIVMSGTMLNYRSITKRADFAYRLAKKYGYQDENVDKKVLNYLKSLPVHNLVDHDLLTDEEKRNGLLNSFGPTVESYVGDDCVIPEAPLEMLHTAWGNNLPMMLGGNSFEGLFMYPRLKGNLKTIEKIALDPTILVPHELRLQHSDTENWLMGQQLMKLHFGNKEPSASTILECLDYYSYRIFWHGFYRTLLSRLKWAPEQPTYFYRFDFDSTDFNFYRKKYCGDDIKTGVAHADDVGYLFYSFMSHKLDQSSAEYKNIERMVGMWTAFATNGNPNCIEIKPLEWCPVKENEPDKVLNISHHLTIIDLPELEKLTTWNGLYKKEDLF